jgi:uncharacterized integral membrane protein (TIGR00698 family)
MMTISKTTNSRAQAAERRPWAHAPGICLCVLIAAAAYALQALEIQRFGRPWLEALVLAILLGTAVRTGWSPGPTWLPGIGFSAKILLEVAIVLLGATISGGAILSVGPALLMGIVGVVCVAILASYGLGRLFGLPRRMAVLIACGNSICGNSAIAAVAPVIGAHSEDVAASIAFTAVLGVLVVLGLPVLALALHMSPREFGVLAGLTVYAVPQVLAATAPISSLSAQIGTVVKLIRVLMLGPVVVALSLAMTMGKPRDRGPSLPPIGQMAPWFILGFLTLVTAGSTHLIPSALIAPSGRLATWLTIVAMAALGLDVDVRVITRAGPRVIAVVSLSLIVLSGVAFTLIHGLGLD